MPSDKLKENELFNKVFSFFKPNWNLELNDEFFLKDNCHSMVKSTVELLSKGIDKEAERFG